MYDASVFVNECVIGPLEDVSVDCKHISSTTRLAMLSLKLSSSEDIWAVCNPTEDSCSSFFFAREALNLSFFSSSLSTSSSLIPTLIMEYVVVPVDHIMEKRKIQYFDRKLT